MVDRYLPALKYRFLTPMFDLMMRCILPEEKFKRRLIEQSHPAHGHRVLDLGCGTATLALWLKQAYPETEVIGLDGDPQILAIARNKIAQAKMAIVLDEGMSFALPYSDHSLDRVLSTLFFHHLTRENKVRTLQEVFRVLRPGGELHVADWGKARSYWMRVAFGTIQIIDGVGTTRDNSQGLLPELFRAAGFVEVEETVYYQTMLGPISLYRARKP